MMPDQPTWEEANPDCRAGDPITPEMVVRTLQSILATGTVPVRGILAQVLFEGDAAPMHLQGSLLPLPLALGMLAVHQQQYIGENLSNTLQDYLPRLARHELEQALQRHEQEHPNTARANAILHKLHDRMDPAALEQFLQQVGEELGIPLADLEEEEAAVGEAGDILQSEDRGKEQA